MQNLNCQDDKRTSLNELNWRIYSAIMRYIILTVCLDNNYREEEFFCLHMYVSGTRCQNDLLVKKHYVPAHIQYEYPSITQKYVLIPFIGVYVCL